MGTALQRSQTVSVRARWTVRVHAPHTTIETVFVLLPFCALGYTTHLHVFENIIYLICLPYLLEHNRYNFVHNYIKLAVEARYCPTTGHRWSVASRQFFFFYDAMQRDDVTSERKQRAEVNLNLRVASVCTTETDCSPFGCIDSDAFVGCAVDISNV